MPSLRRNRSPFAAGGSIPSASHHAGVAGRSSLGAPLRRRGFDYRRPRHFRRSSSGVERRVEGARVGGSIPSFGTNSQASMTDTTWDDSSTGRAAASQAEDAGSSPARSTSLRAKALWLAGQSQSAKAAASQSERAETGRPCDTIDVIGARTRVQTCLASKSGGERYPGAPPAFAPCGRYGSASQHAKAAARRSPKGRRRATKTHSPQASKVHAAAC